MSHDQKLSDLLIQWDERRRSGEEPSATQLCHDCPELADELASRIAALKNTDWMFDDDTAEDDASLALTDTGSSQANAVVLPDSSLSVDQLVAAILQSGLLAESDVVSVRNELADEPSAHDLALELIGRKQLTKFQATSLLEQRPLPLVLGDYEILRRIGAGGMGEVFKARHRRMKRIVALKILPQELTDDALALKRFNREVEIVASLEHANIVTAFDAGETAGTHYLIMQYVEGCDLTMLVQSAGALPVDKAIDFTLQAAKGLAYAHDQGVIHRDIKPSNVLVDKRGRVKILDLGLARFDLSTAQQIDRQDGLTTTGAVMGTVDYMAPEQAMNTRTANHRADIYSLGCTLHFLLTGGPPFGGETMMERLVAHREQSIPSLRSRRDDVPEALDTLFEKMLAKKSDNRFATMNEVVDALESIVTAAEEIAEPSSDKVPVVTGELSAGSGSDRPIDSAPFEDSDTESYAPVVAALSQQEQLSPDDASRDETLNQSESGTDRLKLGTKPAASTPLTETIATQPQPTGSGRRGVKWLVAIALMFAGGFYLFGVLFTVKTPHGTIVLEGDPAVLKTAKVTVDGENLELETDGKNYVVNVDRRSGQLRIVTPGGDELYSDRFTFHTGQDRLPLTVSLDRAQTVAATPGDMNPPTVATWQPGPAEDVLPGLVPRPAKLPGVKRWQVETTAPRSAVYSVDWSPDGRFVACGSIDGAVRIYDGQQLGIVQLLSGHRGGILSVAWSPDGRLLATGSTDRTVRLWNTDGTPGPILRGHTNDVYAVTWSPDGKQLASTGLDHTIRIWDSNGTEKQVFDTPLAGGLRTVVWSPDGKRLAFGYGDNTIRLRSLDGEAEVILKGHTARVYSISWSPDGTALASGSNDKTIRLWNNDGTLAKVMEGHTGSVVCVAWSRDGELLASSGSGDQTIRLWQADGTAVSTLQQETSVQSLAWNPDGERIVAGCLNTTMRVINTDGTTGPVVSTVRGGSTAVDWSPDGRKLAAGYGGGSGEVQLWNTDGEPAEALSAPGGHCLAWSPDGAAVASAAGSELWLMHLDGTEVVKLAGGDGNVDSVAWSPDGKQLAWAKTDGNTVHLAAADGTPGPVFEGAYSVSWSPDGKRLVAGSNKFTPRIWQVDGVPGPELKGYADSAVYAVAWSPDGGMIATGEDMDTIRLWNPDGTPGPVLEGHTDRIGGNSLAWNPDGSRLASGSWDRSVRFWNRDGSAGPVLVGDAGRIASLSWSSDGKRLASGTEENTILVRNAETGEPQWSAVFLPENHKAAFSGGGRLLHGDPEVVEKELAYLIEDSAGARQLLKPVEFNDFIDSGKPFDQWRNPPLLADDAWPLGPAEDVLPGLVPRPAKLPGVKRWQVETTVPRGPVWSVDWSSDGRFVACGSPGGAVRVYEAETLQLVHLLAGHTGDVLSLAWSPDSSTLASAGTDRTVRLWKADGTPGPILKGHTRWVESVSWRPDGKQLASCSGRTVRIWSLDGEQNETLHAGQDGIKCLAWSPDGKHLAKGFGSGAIRLWQADGTPEQTLEGHTASVESVAWSPDGKTLASGSNDKTIRLWNADGAFRQVLDEHAEVVECLAWSHDGEFLASGGGDQTIRRWKADGTEVSSWNHGSHVRSLAWNPNNQSIVAGYFDATVRVSSIDGTPGPATSTVGVASIAVGWSPDGRTLAAGHGGGVGPGEVQLWGVDGAPRTTLQGPGGYCLAWRPDGLALASGGQRSWQLLKLDGTRGAILTDDDVIDSVAWSPDGRQVSWANSVKNAVRLSASDGTPGPVLEGAYSIAWSPDGQRLVTGSRDSTARIWQADGMPGPELEGQSGQAVYAVAWSPDDQLIATGQGSDTNGSVRLWSPDGKPGPELEGHTHRLGNDCLSWNPDSSRLASGSWDGTVRLWNRDGTAGPVLVGDGGRIASLSWTSDGKRLASGTLSNTILVRDADTGDPEWSAVFLPENKKAVFIGGGRLLHGDPEVVEKELAYLIEDSAGARHLLKPAEFNDFIDSGKPFDQWRNLPLLADGPWQLGPAEDVLPGLIPRPATFSGLARWQIETVAPRGEIHALAYSPDSRYLACGSSDGQIRVYETATGQIKKLFSGHPGNITSLAWNSTGTWLASGGKRGNLRLWNVEQSAAGAVLMNTGAGDNPRGLVWSPDDSQIAAAIEYASSIEVWNAQSGEKARSIRFKGFQTLSLDWSPDGKWLAAGCSDHKIRFWSADADQHEPAFELEGHTGVVPTVAFSPDGTRLASGGHHGDYSLRIWNLETRKVEHVVRGLHQRAAIDEDVWSDEDVRSLAWSPNGGRVAFTNSAAVAVWDAQTEKIVLSLEGHRGSVFAVAWSGDGRQIASGDASHTLRLWNANDGTLQRTIGVPIGTAWPAWSPDGGTIAVGTQDVTLRLLDASNGRTKPMMNALSDIDDHIRDCVFGGLSWTNDSRQVVVGVLAGETRAIRYYNSHDGSAGPFREHTHQAAVSPDGKQVVWHASEASLDRWIPASGELQHKFITDVGSAGYPTWSPDGKWIAAFRNDDLAVCLFDVEGRKSGPTFEGHQDDATAGYMLAWSPDSQWLAAGTSQRNIVIYPVGANPRKEPIVWESTLGMARSVAFSPDGRWLAAGGYYDRQIALWDMAASKPGPTFDNSSTEQSDMVTWNADSSQICSGTRHHTVRVLNIADGEVQWVGVMLPGGNAASFTAAGEFLHGQREAVQQELIYIAETDDGHIETLTPAEFTGSIESGSYRPKPQTEFAWQPGPAEDVLPGLIPQPAKLPGIKGWQVETDYPRGGIAGLDYSPDGKWLAVGSADGHVRIYDVDTLKLQKMLVGHAYGIVNVVWSPDGSRIATMAPQEPVRIWDVASGKTVRQLPTKRPIPGFWFYKSLAWRPDGRHVAIAVEQDLTVWDVESGEPVFEVKANHCYAVAWSPDGERIATAGRDKQVRVWNADGTAGPVFDGHTAEIMHLAWSPDGKQIASGARREESVVRIWDVESQKTVRVLTRPDGTTWDFQMVDWRHDGKALAATSGRELFLWDLTAQSDGVLIGSGGHYMAWRPDGKQVATAGGGIGGYVIECRLWDPETKKSQSLFESPMVKAAWSPDGKTLAAGTSGGAVHLWNAQTSAQQRVMQQEVGVSDVAWSRDGTQLATAGGTLKIWNPTDASLTRELGAGGDHLAFSLDGKLIAKTLRTRGVEIWDVEEGKRSEVLRGSESDHRGVAWNGDGTRVAVGCVDGLVYVWDRSGDKNPVALDGHDGRTIFSVAWSPDGKWLASGSGDRTVAAWDARNLSAEAKPLHRFQVGLYSADLAWSADSRWLASPGADETDRNVVHLWDASTQQVAMVFPHQGGATNVSFDARRGHLATSGWDGAVRIWNTESQQLQRLSLLLPGAQSATFSPAGELLQKTENAKDHLAYLIENEDGTRELLKPSEFQRRINQTPRYDPLQPQLATDADRRVALWVLAKGGGVKVSGQEHDNQHLYKAEQLPEQSFELNEVTFHEVLDVVDEDLVQLTELSHLKRLDFGNFPISDAGMQHISQLSSLESLELPYSRVTDEGIALLKDLPKLRVVRVGGIDTNNRSKGLGDGAARTLSEMKQLEEVTLNRCELTDTGLGHLSQLSGLKRLEVSHTDITDAGFEHISRLRDLSFLDVTATETTDNAMPHIAKLRNLTHLNLSVCAQITDTGVAHLRGLTRLQYLSLSSTQLTEAGMVNLESMKDLSLLFLVGTAIGDDGLAHLAQLRDLKFLEVYRCNITDAGLSNVSRITSLQSLSLAGNKITDTGLEQLYQLSNLELVYLTETDVTAAGIAKLQKALPDCKIEWNAP